MNEPPMVPPPAEDAELCDLCSHFAALERRAVAAAKSDLPPEEVSRIETACDEEQGSLAARICAMPAATPAGILAKLRALAVYSPAMVELDPREMQGAEDLFIGSVLRDVLGAAAARPEPDRFRTAHARRALAQRLAAEALDARRQAEGQIAKAEAKLRRAAELEMWP